MEAAVYWLHLPTHDNVLQDGYVGVSKTPTERMCKHLSAAKEAKHENPHLLNAIVKSGNTIVQDVIAVGSEEYCYEIEAKLRPQWEIGWNIIPGGRSPPSLSDRVWINDGKNHKRIRGCDRENYPDWVDGRVNVFSEEEKTKRKKRMSGKGNPFYGHKHDKETKEKCGIKPQGFVSHNGKSIIFRGNEYLSLAKASIATGISTYLIKKESETL